MLRSSDAILVVDSAGVLRYASPAFGRMVTIEESMVGGQPLTDFVGAAQASELLTGAPETSSGQPARWRIGAADGPRDVEVVATDLRGDPTVGGIVVNLRDVTERVRLEAQLRQAQKLEVVGRLASTIAHDFNNVLAGVLGNARMARMDGSHSGSEELSAIEAAAERGAALARQLLALSRPTPLNSRILDLSEEVRGMERTLRSVLPSSIAVEVTTATDPVPARLDGVQVEQVLLNLALNARDAMPTGGRLAMDVSSVALAEEDPKRPRDLGPGRWARINVTDSGLGMDAETVSRAFEPFFTTKPSGVGTGLGLSTVQRIVTEAGGQVIITSSLNQGTTVTIYVPVLPTTAPLKSRDHPPDPARGRGHLLVVEDEAAVRRVLVRYLSRAGYTVSEAVDGVEAIDVLNRLEWRVDLVLTDLVMPRMGGRDLAMRVRERNSRLPVLCMSGTPGTLGTGDGPWSSERVIPKPSPLEFVVSRIAEALTPGLPG